MGHGKKPQKPSQRHPPATVKIHRAGSGVGGPSGSAPRRRCWQVPVEDQTAEASRLVPGGNVDGTVSDGRIMLHRSGGGVFGFVPQQSAAAVLAELRAVGQLAVMGNVARVSPELVVELCLD